jgi:hypothetical protein
MLVASSAPAAETKPPAADGLAPQVLGTDDLGIPSVRKPPAPAAPKADAPTTSIEVDASARAVRIPVRVTGSRGVVEWLLASDGRHAGTSVLVTAHTAAQVAEALEKSGLAAGTPPVKVGSDRARPPAGAAVEVALIVRTGDGKTARTPASRLIAPKAGGEEAGPGAWVYVGPRRLEGDGVKVLLPALSGSVVTTNPRDSSACVYWSPAGEDDDAPYVREWYASAASPAVPDGASCLLEIRPAAVAARPEDPPAKPEDPAGKP